jgi:hypothetical protein
VEADFLNEGSEAGPAREEQVKQAVDGLIRAYQSADPEMGEPHVHLPTTEIIEWKGLANIWHANVDEFRQTVEAHREEPIQQETITERIEWLSELTALVRRDVKTSLPDGRSFVSPAVFIVTPDRAGIYKVALTWWGAFPDWFQG